ncbi:hypothetical protein L204_103566 [Cryptococcus depauperatus]|nr:hypothetical protein L204_01881 [Cryptococcus depauperatus CBS 7855]
MTQSPTTAKGFPTIIWHPAYSPSSIDGSGTGNPSLALPNGERLTGDVLRPWMPPQATAQEERESTSAEAITQGFSSISISGDKHTLPSFQDDSKKTVPQAYIAYPELTCLHCLGANPPGKLGYIVSYVPAAISSSGNPVSLGSPWQEVSHLDGQTCSQASRPVNRTGRPAVVKEEDEEEEGRGRTVAHSQHRNQSSRSRSAFRAADVVGDKQYVPDGTEDDLVADVVE